MRIRPATVALLLLATLVGCGRPIRAITSNKVFMPNGVSMSGRVVTKVEENDSTTPIVATMVATPPSGCDCPRVALLEIDGLIFNSGVSMGLQDSDNPVALFREKVDLAVADADVRAIVVRINSPGGSVVASDILFHDLEQLRERTGKPIVAYIMGLGTGGGYYVATVADTIYAHPNSIVGGIGVIFNHYDLYDTMYQQNIKAAPVKAGDNIDMGTYIEELSKDSRGWLQQMADEFHNRFKEVVVRRRPSVNRDPSTFDGRVFAAGQSLDRGMIDRVGYLEEAIAAAQELAGAGECAVVMYHRTNNPPRSIYATDGLDPAPKQLVPMSIPGMERSRLPGFLYLWQVDPTIERITTP
jgi:protease-4